MLVWKDEYCTGMERIDNAHRLLVDQLNALYARMGTDFSPERGNELLSRFCRHVELLFATEEYLAVEGGVPPHKLDAHFAEHQAYRQRVASYRTALDCGDTLACVQLMAFLHYWWVTHMLGANRVLGRLLRERERV